MILHHSHARGGVWAAVPETDMSGAYRVIINDVDVYYSRKSPQLLCHSKLLSVYLLYENGTPARVQLRVAR